MIYLSQFQSQHLDVQLDEGLVHMSKVPKYSVESVLMTTRASTENEYIIANLKCIAVLINAIIKEHPIQCEHDLTLQTANKKILSTSILVTCKKCQFKSGLFKMYQEVKMEGSTAGLYQSSLNLALGTTIQTLPINSTNFIHLAAGLGIDPPSHSGMQRLMDKCNKINVLLADKSIAAEVEKAKLRKKKTSELHVSEDAMYSNGMFSSSTPTHAANQAYMTVINQETNKVLHLGVYNKQCHLGKLTATQQGGKILCGTNDVDHKGDCSANLHPDAPIGREADYILKAAKDLRQQNADPTSMTKDGDGPVRKALLDFYGVDSLEILSDEHHVNSCFKKKVRKTKFSKTMFDARTKKIQQHHINNFAEDIASRCHTELLKARSKFSHLESIQRKLQIIESLKDTPKAILSCIKGDHSKCSDSSFLCNPEEEKHWSFSFLHRHSRSLELEEVDSKALTHLLQMRIGPDALKALWRGTSTQINEAFNRKIRKHLPKATNFTRNCTGRVMSAAHFQNDGYKTATDAVHQYIGFQTCQKVESKIMKEESKQTIMKFHQRKQSSKTQRFQRKFLKFQKHRSKFIVDKHRHRDDDGDDDDENDDESGYKKHCDL